MVDKTPWGCAVGLLLCAASALTVLYVLLLFFWPLFERIVEGFYRGT